MKHNKTRMNAKIVFFVIVLLFSSSLSFAAVNIVIEPSSAPVSTPDLQLVTDEGAITTNAISVQNINITGQTINGLAYLDPSGKINTSGKLAYSNTNRQLYWTDGGSNSAYGIAYFYDLTHSFKDVITIAKVTWGSAISASLATLSPVIKATGGSTFVDYSINDAGTYLYNSYVRGGSFAIRSDTNNYGTYGFYAKGSNLNTAPTTSGVAMRGRSYGVVGEAQSSTTGTGGAGLRGIASSSNVSGVLIDTFSGQNAPLLLARTIDNVNDASLTVDTTIFKFDADGSLDATKLYLGSNTAEGLSAGDINASNIYYDTLNAKSPLFFCDSHSFKCKVEDLETEETYYIQFNSDWEIENVKDNKKLAKRVDDKIIRLQEKKQEDTNIKSCINTGDFWQWTGSNCEYDFKSACESDGYSVFNSKNGDCVENPIVKCDISQTNKWNYETKTCDTNSEKVCQNLGNVWTGSECRTLNVQEQQEKLKQECLQDKHQYWDKNKGCVSLI